MTTTRDKMLTADDLLELHSKGVRGELIRGRLGGTMSTGVNHGKTVANLTILLGAFIKPQRLGMLVTSDTGTLLDAARHTVRDPDIGYFSAEKMPRCSHWERAIRWMAARCCPGFRAR